MVALVLVVVVILVVVVMVGVVLPFLPSASPSFSPFIGLTKVIGSLQYMGELTLAH